MPAVMGIATINAGESDGKDLFVVVSDGSETKFFIPAETPEDIKEDILTAVGWRLAATDSTDPEEIVEDMVYNFPADISVSDPLETFEDAVKRAQDYMVLVNDFEGDPSEPLDAIIPSEEA